MLYVLGLIVYLTLGWAWTRFYIHSVRDSIFPVDWYTMLGTPVFWPIHAAFYTILGGFYLIFLAGEFVYKNISVSKIPRLIKKSYNI
jgi:hypothetical protein